MRPTLCILMLTILVGWNALIALDNMEWQWTWDDSKTPAALYLYLTRNNLSEYDIAIECRKEKINEHPLVLRVFGVGTTNFSIGYDGYSPFSIHGDYLYVFSFDTQKPGCVIMRYAINGQEPPVAYRLNAVGRVGHSVYNNFVQLEIVEIDQKPVFKILGKESVGNYIEYFDIETNKTFLTLQRFYEYINDEVQLGPVIIYKKSE